MKIETKFDICQRVYILELKIYGKIIAIHINNSTRYLVRYFDDKISQECYFYEDELSLQDEETKLGFKT